MIVRLEITGPLRTNCYLIADPDSHEAGVIDPGGPVPMLTGELVRLGWTVRWVLLTHGHVDHFGGLPTIRRLTKAPVLIHKFDSASLSDPVLNMSALLGRPFCVGAPDTLLEGGEELQLGTHRLPVWHTPGHTPGHIALGTPLGIFTGDTLVPGHRSFGGLPGGSDQALAASVAFLLSFPPNTMLFTGHGTPETVNHF